jgi:hypothetical protein
MSQFLRPQSDVSLDSAWADFNTLPISTTISDINDATFIEAQPGTLSATFVVELSPGNTPIAGDRILRWRVSKNEAGGQTRAFSIRLKSATDVVLVDTITGTVGDTFDTYSWVVSEEITDYEGLRVEFTDQRFGTGDDRSIRVAFIEFEIPAAILDVSVEPDLVEYEVEPLAVDVNAERRTTINADLLEAEIDTLSPTIFAVRNESFEVGTINYEVESFEASVSTRETPITVITQNPSLYDKKCPRFILIRNTELKILDGDTINISSFSDYLLLEDEPEGFDNAKLLLERDEEYHGFNYEYQVDALRFDCNYGKPYLDNIFEEDGTDANVIFIYGYGDLDTVDVLYVGGIDFNEWGVEDSEYTVMNIRKDDFGNVLQSNFDVPQKFIPDQEVLLYSKAIPKKVTYRIPAADSTLSFTGITPVAYYATSFNGNISKASGSNGYVFFNDGKEGDSNFEIFPTYDFQVDNLEPRQPSKRKFLFRSKQSARYTIDIKLALGLKMSAGLENFVDFSWCTLRIIKTGLDGVTVISSELPIEATEVLIDVDTITADRVLVFDVTYSTSVNLEECLYLYIEMDKTASSFPSGSVIRQITAQPFNGDTTVPQISIVAETLSPFSFTKLSKPFNALTSVFKTASLLDYNPVISEFFDGGCGSLLYLTNGFWIRGGERITSIDAEKLEIKQSPKQLIDKLGKLFNLGWGIEYDYTMNEVVRIEPAEYFYQDVEILTLDENNISDYVKQVDSSKVFNEIEVGFSKYSKNRETDKGNTIDDFHTKHIYSTPIQRNKAKQTIITDLVLSAYEIEITRRKQFEDNGENASANYGNDDDLFGVQILSETPFTGGTYTGLLTDLSAGDIIVITDEYIVIVGKQYFYAGQRVGVNVDGNFTNTSILSIEFGEFTPIGFPFAVEGTRINFTSPLPQQVSPLTPVVTIAAVSTGAVPSINAQIQNDNTIPLCFDEFGNGVTCGSVDEDYITVDLGYEIKVSVSIEYTILSITISDSAVPDGVTLLGVTVEDSQNSVIGIDFSGYDSRDLFFVNYQIISQLDGEDYERLTIQTGYGGGEVSVRVLSREFFVNPTSLDGYLVPESDEPFVVGSISNLLSQQTTYNLRYTPKRMLLQHAKMFMGAFRTKDEDVEVIEFKQGDGNTLLRTEFGAGEECLLGDVNRIDLGEGDSLSLAQTFNNEYLFLPYKVTFSYPLSFEELNYIRRAMRGYSEDTNNYGYLSYVNPKGQAEQIYLTSISYSPAKEEAEISGWVKGNYNYIHNSTT